MYSFSISIHEHVPLNMSAGRIFPREGLLQVWAKNIFSGGTSAKIIFSPLETKKTTFLSKNLKMSILKTWGSLGPPSDTHAPNTCDDKKAEEDNKNIFTNTFAPGLIQAVRTKTAGLHMALCGNFSSPVCSTDPVNSSKHSANLVVCTQKKFLVGGSFFLWVMS